MRIRDRNTMALFLKLNGNPNSYCNTFVSTQKLVLKQKACKKTAIYRPTIF